jgi:hypothetical protein
MMVVTEILLGTWSLARCAQAIGKWFTNSWPCHIHWLMGNALASNFEECDMVQDILEAAVILWKVGCKI